MSSAPAPTGPLLGASYNSEIDDNVGSAASSYYQAPVAPAAKPSGGASSKRGHAGAEAVAEDELRTPSKRMKTVAQQQFAHATEAEASPPSSKSPIFASPSQVAQPLQGVGAEEGHAFTLPNASVERTAVERLAKPLKVGQDLFLTILRGEIRKKD